jgi:hypothetical protein
MPGSPSIAKPPPDPADAAQPERRAKPAASTADAGRGSIADARPAGAWPIAILSFDRPRYLERVLDSLKSQIGCDLEDRSVTLFRTSRILFARHLTGREHETAISSIFSTATGSRTGSATSCAMPTRTTMCARRRGPLPSPAMTSIRSPYRTISRSSSS